MITIIAAVARNLAIGKAGQLIYRLPNDMRRFKALTTGNTVIMGRRTFESLPKGALPHRRNIVLSRTASHFDGCDCYRSLAEATASCKSSDRVFVIGGASVYAEAMDIADRLCLTEVDDTPTDADTFFPSYDKDTWVAVAREPHQADEKHKFAYTFVDYERRNGGKHR